MPNGEIRPEVQPQGIATLLISTLEGSTAISRIDKRSQALRHARQNLDRFLEGMVRLPADHSLRASPTNR